MFASFSTINNSLSSASEQIHFSWRPRTWASTFMMNSIENYATHKKFLILETFSLLVILSSNETFFSKHSNSGNCFFSSALFITSNIDMKVTYVVHKHLVGKRMRRRESFAKVNSNREEIKNLLCSLLSIILHSMWKLDVAFNIPLNNKKSRPQVE